MNAQSLLDQLRVQGKVVEGESVLEAHSWQSRTLGSKNTADLSTAFFCTGNGRGRLCVKTLQRVTHAMNTTHTHTQVYCTTSRREGSTWRETSWKDSPSSYACTRPARYWQLSHTT